MIDWLHHRRPKECSCGRADIRLPPQMVGSPDLASSSSCFWASHLSLRLKLTLCQVTYDQSNEWQGFLCSPQQGERILIPPTAEECAKNHPNAKNFVVEKMS